MTTQQIGYFLKLAEELNYTTVAQMFFITQPTLSKQIVNMENELKITLFDRSHNGVTLTPAGKKFYDKIKPIFLDLMGAIRDAQELDETSDTLVIGIQEEQIISNSLMLAINLLRHDYPDVKISIHRANSEELIEGLTTGKYDIVNILVYPNFRYGDKYELLEIEIEDSYLAYSKNILELDEEISMDMLGEILEKHPLLLPNVFGGVDDMQAKKMFVKNMKGLDADSVNIRVEQSGRPISLPIQVSSGLGVSLCNKTNLFSIDPTVKMTHIAGIKDSYVKGLLYNKQPSSPYIKVILNKVKSLKSETL
ncbi:MAG: LysR family transcriptional regulator [Parasporobacterium sp.]|nr:LysR family transcriptional regulator [Parasporobacterium sp.]